MQPDRKVPEQDLRLLSARRSRFSEPMQTLAPFRACFAVLAAIVTFGVLFPHARTWGFHFLAYYSFESRLLLAGAAALLALLSLWPSWIAAAVARIRQVQLHPLLFDAILALLCGVAFYVFASAVPLLGDGQLWIDELSSPDADIWGRRGPLTMLALDQLHYALRPLIGMDVPGVFRLTSALSGVVAVLAWLCFAREAGTGPLLVCYGDLRGAARRSFSAMWNSTSSWPVCSVRCWRLCSSACDAESSASGCRC